MLYRCMRGAAYSPELTAISLKSDSSKLRRSYSCDRITSNLLDKVCEIDMEPTRDRASEESNLDSTLNSCNSENKVKIHLYFYLEITTLEEYMHGTYIVQIVFKYYT